MPTWAVVPPASCERIPVLEVVSAHSGRLFVPEGHCWATWQKGGINASVGVKPQSLP